MKTDLLKLTPVQFCTVTNAPADLRSFASNQPDLSGLWDNCPSGAWLTWIVGALGISLAPQVEVGLAARMIRETTLSDGRLVWDAMKDHRGRAVVETAERFAKGQATAHELAAAVGGEEAAANASLGTPAGAATLFGAWSAGATCSAGPVGQLEQARIIRSVVRNPFRP